MSIATLPPRSTTSAPTAVQRHLHLVPDAHRPATPGAEARGFALYVGLDETKARAAGTDLATVVAALRALAAELVPDAGTYAAVALAPAGTGGQDVDVVRRALGATPPAERPSRATGVVVDLGRRRILLDGADAGLTYREFELLQFLVLREGRTVGREEIVEGLWSGATDEDAPNERTIDVHVRRLRAKLGDYAPIVRTVRGEGYRFDRHADVQVRWGQAPSPDRV